MFSISKDTIGEAHEALIALIVTAGDELRTEDDEATLEMCEPLSVNIRSPERQPMVSSASPYGPQFMGKYVDEMVCPGPTKFTYTYANRFMDHPRGITGMIPDGDGNGRGLDQIYFIVRKLAQNPETRRAVAISWYPEKDMHSDDPPCIDLLQFFIRGQYLNLIAYIRSNDMLMAWGCNAYALTHLMRYVAEGVNDLTSMKTAERRYHVGYLETISASAHIYYKRDQNYLDEFRRKLRI